MFWHIVKSSYTAFIRRLTVQLKEPIGLIKLIATSCRVVASYTGVRIGSTFLHLLQTYRQKRAKKLIFHVVVNFQLLLNIKVIPRNRKASRHRRTAVRGCPVPCVRVYRWTRHSVKAEDSLTNLLVDITVWHTLSFIKSVFAQLFQIGRATILLSRILS